MVVNSVSSASHFPKEGIPQGSVLGPLCIFMYTAPLDKIIENYGVERIYGGDTHISSVARIFQQGAKKTRKFLDRGTTEKLVRAFITCHLDYCMVFQIRF